MVERWPPAGLAPREFRWFLHHMVLQLETFEQAFGFKNGVRF